METNGARVIKKYYNRRLYDTRGGGYVTMDDVVRMIRDGERVVVIRQNGGEDITRDVLFETLRQVETRRSEPKLGVESLMELLR